MAEESQINDCWNRIGIWSSEGASCPELLQVVHCRNCETYIETGRRMLDRKISRVDAAERTEFYRQPLARENEIEYQVTLFRLGEEFLALENKYIEAVIVPRECRWIPHVSGKIVKGLINVNGEQILVVGVDKLLGIEEQTSLAAEQMHRHLFPRMILIRNGQSILAFHVDEVIGGHRFNRGDIKSVPDTVGKAIVTYSIGLLDVAQGQAGLLDGMLLLYGLEQNLT